MKLSRKLALISTLVFSANLAFPLFVMAQTSSSGQGEETIQPGILELTNVPANFSFPAVSITNFQTYDTVYENQQTNAEKLTAEDKRFSGGFEVQVTATDYIGQNNASNTLPTSDLGMLTQVPNSTNNYTQTTHLSNTYSGSEGTLLAGSQSFAAVLSQTLPFNFTMFGRESNKIFICTSGFIIQAPDFSSLSTSAFDQRCQGTTSFFPTGAYGVIYPYMTATSGNSKMITSTFGSSTNGIYYNQVSDNEVHIRYKGSTRNFDSTQFGNVEFTVYLFRDGRIEYHYGPDTDSFSQPSIGIMNNQPQTTIDANINPFGRPFNHGTTYQNAQIRFTPVSTEFNEITKPDTPPAYAPTNANSVEDTTNFTMFTEDTDNPGFSIPVTTIEAAACAFQGRLGNYTVFPSFILAIPPTTAADTYQNTITFTIIDKTVPLFSGFCSPSLGGGGGGPGGGGS